MARVKTSRAFFVFISCKVKNSSTPFFQDLHISNQFEFKKMATKNNVGADMRKGPPCENQGLLQEIASRQVQYDKEKSDEFRAVIVYFDKDQETDYSGKQSLGRFHTFDIDYITPPVKMTDWDVEHGQYLNRVRTPVKPVRLILTPTKTVEAPLFSRVRGFANRVAVRQIIQKLNHQLNIYKDHVRDGIAEEWCAQELWRIYPRFPEQCLRPVGFDKDGKPTGYYTPPFDLKATMKELLPDGYDDEWPA